MYHKYHPSNHVADTVPQSKLAGITSPKATKKGVKIANSFGDKFYISEGSGANQMTDFIYNAVAASDAIELIPPATF